MITPRVRSASKKLRKLYHKLKHSPSHNMKQVYITQRSHLQTLQRQAYWDYVNNLIEPPEDDVNTSYTVPQKRFWSYIKALRKDTTGITALRSGGKLFSGPKDKADILNKQYQSVFTRENTDNIPCMEGPTLPSIPDIIVNAEGVLSLLLKLNPYKAGGPDKIPARVLHECANSIAPFLTKIFQKSLDSGVVPDDWKKANVTAIFKKGDRCDASNYRPVSLTSLCCKLLEHIITSNIMKHLDKYKVLSDCQHGFRAKRSCETQLLTLSHELTSAIDRRKQIDLIILDFSKAFDKVPHQRLLHKLNHYGIHNSCYRWIANFLDDRTQQVVVDGACSYQAPVISGVHQGTVLGPLLFLLFINDLPNGLRSNIRLFADDCIVYREINSQSDSQILQDDLNTLANWESRWGMKFHPSKCNVMSCCRLRNPKHFSYKLRGHILERSLCTKYLGVDIQHNLSWNQHISRTTNKAHSMLGFLRRNLKSAKLNTKANAYKALVRPHVEYCCTIWSPFQQNLINKVEAVQRKAARFVCNNYHNTSSVTSMLNELQWDSLSLRRSRAQLTMLYKILYKHVDIDPTLYLSPASSRTRSQHSYKFRQIHANTDIFKFSFFPRVVPLWNSLPASVAEAPSLGIFKRGVSTMSM